MPLILASASPRRRELLASAGFQFEVVVPVIDETPLPGEPPRATVLRLAREKASDVAAKHPGHLVLAADTTVVLDGRMMEKPRDGDEARHMLLSLSGRTHEVLTAFALWQNNSLHSDVCTTRVTFRSLSQDEIETYVATGEPMDKAGAYGIQSGAAHMVRAIHGSYTNVVGLPLAEIVEFLHIPHPMTPD